ncbi:unnamed protein product [marine sediment metagenome]|uniref:Uncharacterized protein n=1 Tax=marine sediment metagenome TaxID=412755 RepID=X1BAV9_9ZZZZ
MSQTLFNSKSVHVPPKCVRCEIDLANYSLWHEDEGPLCYLCKVKLKAEN